MSSAHPPTPASPPNPGPTPAPIPTPPPSSSTPAAPSRSPAPSAASPARDGFLADYAALARNNGHAPAWLTERRDEAAAHFRALGFPTTRQEAWRKTNLQPVARTTFAHANARAGAGALDADAVAALDRLALFDLAGHRLVFVNGVFDAERSSVGPLPAGVRIGSLGQAWRADDEAVVAHYGRCGDDEDAPFVALNTALAHDGALIVLPADAVVDAPIHLVFCCAPDAALAGTPDGRPSPAPDAATPAPIAHHPRVLIVAGARSRATVVESYGALRGDAVYLTNTVTEVHLAEGAEIDHTKRQLESETAYHFGVVNVVQAGASRYVNHNVALGGRLVRNEVAVQIAASGCDTLLHGLYMGHGGQHIDNVTRLDHAQPGCHSFELYKGVLDGSATAVFTGRIMVRQDAQQTDAVQENRCLLLADTARINTQPQLQIYADDVKCTHGASIGELDATQLIYLQARGIPPAEASGILTYAYANEIIERIPVERVRDELEGLIRARVRESRRLKD